jgi:Zn-finger nucleic acid-binding protein
MSLICPKCRGTMDSYERNGVAVDQCADCRGLFLDRGELERLVDAERAWGGVTAQQSAQPVQYQHHGKPHYKKRKSFLSELFDD